MEDNTAFALENLHLRQLLKEREEETEHYRKLYEGELERRKKLEEKVAMLEAGRAALVARIDEEVKKKNDLKTSRFVAIKRNLDTGDLATMETEIYHALKADVMVKCSQKRVVLSPFGRECAGDIKRKREDDNLVTTQNQGMEKVKSLEGQIGSLLQPFQTIKDDLSNRKKKEAKHLLSSYEEKAQKGYMVAEQRDKFIKMSKELDGLPGNSRPVGEPLFKKVLNILNSVTPVSNI